MDRLQRVVLLPLFLVLVFLVIGGLVACVPAIPAAVLPDAPPADLSPAAVNSGGPVRSAPQPTPSPTPATQGSLGQAAASTTTEQQIHSVYLPPRDRIALAQRFLGVTDIPAPPQTPAQVWEAGDVSQFWVDNPETDEKYQVDAVLQFRTEHVLMWVETGYSVDWNALRRSAETFETVILPTVRAAFGQEASPGVDGDPALYILHVGDMGFGLAAAFYAEHAYPPEAVSTSNGHEMFLVNLNTMAASIGTTYYNSVLAHEFQHMIHWNADINEDTWLNEGLSELAALLSGFDNTGFAPDFLRQPETQLNTWPENASRLPHYGGAFLFITYFYERFGASAVQHLVANPANGMEGIESTLRAINAQDPVSGQPYTVDDLFADWVLANLLRDRNVAGDRYAYALVNPALPTVNVTGATAFPYEQPSGPLPQYGTHYYHLDSLASSTVEVSFSGSEAVRLVPVDAYSGSYMWYSNRGDASDSMLTRAFDLAGVDTATLEFATWYHLEHLWDYAYLLASVDGGQSWAFLETHRTTTENPHNNAYGPGYTGSSGSNLLGPVGWVTESVDLTPFAGEQVLLRFEMITDEATNQPGMVVDDIRIPEIGYAEDFENGPGGWASDGWLYIDNTLPQRWLVQVVTLDGSDPGGGAVEVTRLIDADAVASGTWQLTIGGGRDVFLAISPLAPVTTEAAQYRLNIHRVE